MNGLDLRGSIPGDESFHLSCQRKTGQDVAVLVTDVMREILLRYGWKAPKLSNQKCNTYIKEIGKRAGLDELVAVQRMSGPNKDVKRVPKWQLLTTHVGRGTFITHLLNNGVPMHLAAKLSGHRQVRQLLDYDKSSSREAADMARKVFGGCRFFILKINKLYRDKLKRTVFYKKL